MSVKVLKPKNYNYGIIQRGTSLTIPVIIKDSKDNPLDLTNMLASFTIKAVKTDYDRKDQRAYLQKDVVPQEPLFGKFYIRLSSEELDFDPGGYFFDVEISSIEGAVFRLGTFDFILDGGPTNRLINDKIGQLPVGDEILIIALEYGKPIINITSPVIASAAIFDKVEKMEEILDNHEVQIGELTTESIEVKDQLILEMIKTEKLQNEMLIAKEDIKNIEEELIALIKRVDKL